MRQSRHRTLITALASLAVIALAVVVMAQAPAMTAKSQSPAAGPVHTQKVVSKYLNDMDSAMASPSCDFSALSADFTPDAVVTLTGGPFSPGGPFGPGNNFGAQQYHGTQAILGFYTQLCHILYTKNVGAPSWTQDQGYLLAPTVLNSYEHVSFSGHYAGRCMHVFTVQSDRIASLNWSVYA